MKKLKESGALWWIVLGAVIGIIIVAIFIYSPAKSAPATKDVVKEKEVVNETPKGPFNATIYYKNLMYMCKENNLSSEAGCCLESIGIMKLRSYNLTDGEGNCPEGYAPKNLTRCKGTYLWCAPVLLSNVSIAANATNETIAGTDVNITANLTKSDISISNVSANLTEGNTTIAANLTDVNATVNSSGNSS